MYRPPVGVLASAVLYIYAFLEIILIELYMPEHFGFLKLFYLSALIHPFFFGTKPIFLSNRADVYIMSTFINLNNFLK